MSLRETVHKLLAACREVLGRLDRRHAPAEYSLLEPSRGFGRSSHRLSLA